MDQFDSLAHSIKKQFVKLAERLWGCRHKRTSFPITIAGETAPETYVVCTQCGRRFPYDWARMNKTGGTG